MTAAGHCGYCQEPLPEDAVSDYYCSQGHQDLWHMRRSESLDGRPGKPHLTWDHQAQQISATMTGIRAAFAELGQVVQRCSEQFDHLTETTGQPSVK